MGRSCYRCKEFVLCRLRDRACELKDYFNKTGNFMGNEFSDDLYRLMGSQCFEYGEANENGNT